MTRYLIFDLDNTLYSSRYGLEENFRERMEKYVAGVLGITAEEFWKERKALSNKYGTTLEWLMNEKGFTDIEPYLAAVHPKGEADNLLPDPQLKIFLENIPIPKAILTNSPMEHVTLVLDKLGIPVSLFTHIFDIRQFAFKCKPHPETYDRVLKILGVKLNEVLFIDDNPMYAQYFINMGGRALLIDEENILTDYPHQKIRDLKEITRYL